MTIVQASSTVVTVANTTTETILASFTVPAYKMVPDKLLRVIARGVHSTSVASAPSLTLRLRWGGVAGTLLGASGGAVLPGSLANRGWLFEADIIGITAGATGTVECQGLFTHALTVNTIGGDDVENTAAITVDTTADQVLALTAQWDTANAGITISLRTAAFEMYY